MELFWALVIGALYAAGIYMILRLSLVKVIIGLMLLGHGTNLLIFTSARLTRGAPPLIAPDADALVAPYADPLPQALVLTAIVIGFGVQAFALVLFKRVYQSVGADDLNQLRDTDKEP